MLIFNELFEESREQNVLTNITAHEHTHIQTLVCTGHCTFSLPQPHINTVHCVTGLSVRLSSRPQSQIFPRMVENLIYSHFNNISFNLTEETGIIIIIH